MLLLLDVFFNYLDPITYGGALLFDVAAIAFMIVAFSVWKTEDSGQGNM